MKTKYGIWKSVGDRFTRKFLNLKFMMMSHEFLYACDASEKKNLSRKDR
jgi:hypothetical protein